jgi:hypothetical protein
MPPPSSRKVLPVSALPIALRRRLPFLVAGFLSFLFSVYLYFVADEQTAGIFVGLWVPSIHSLGALLMAPEAAVAASQEAELTS